MKTKFVALTSVFCVLYVAVLEIGWCEMPKVWEVPLAHEYNNKSSGPAHLPMATITKWKDNRKGAVSITYDNGPFDEHNQHTEGTVISKGLCISYAFTGVHVGSSEQLIYRDFLSKGFQFFGHGYRHENADQLTYTEAFISFVKCYQRMYNLGLKPVAYAYPNGRGYRASTVAALKASGFLCGRMHNSSDSANPYIMSYDMLEPHDWMRLPSLVMQDYSFAHNKAAVNNNAELLPFLDETLSRKAWVILAYHEIGNEDGWGYYNLSEYQKDLDAIKNRDFWVASMNDIALYAYERARTTIQLDATKVDSGVATLLLTDGLRNDYFDFPLTVMFTGPSAWKNKKYRVSHDGMVVLKGVFSGDFALFQFVPDESPYIVSLAE